jgi:hypothetical protein
MKTSPFPFFLLATACFFCRSSAETDVKSHILECYKYNAPPEANIDTNLAASVIDKTSMHEMDRLFGRDVSGGGGSAPLSRIYFVRDIERAVRGSRFADFCIDAGDEFRQFQDGIDLAIGDRTLSFKIKSGIVLPLGPNEKLIIKSQKSIRYEWCF